MMKKFLRLFLFIAGLVAIGTGWWMTTQQTKTVVIELQIPQKEIWI